MPRVANPPVKAHHGRRSSGKQGTNTTPHKNTPMKIPLNDDINEKAARLQSRQAAYDLQMNQIKAAVKTPMPMRRVNNYERASSNSPRTPSGARVRDGDTDALGRAVTPMKRVPILANFEEWMKMATDNKINATNSWNFALIDYFHDMSLLKEGDGVNFQKASCTLDGCVKIYTSRVDSVATETGKLLSGLADSGNNKKRRTDGEDGAEDDEDEEEAGEDGVRRKARKKARSHEATLAPSFAQLQLKKFELEFSVDPLFKKASADFDEGGAKGLLLNHLAIDGQGRIVFDSSDDVDVTAEADDDREKTAEPEGSKSPAPRQTTTDSSDDFLDVDIASLGAKFFPDLDLLAEQDICPSLKDFDLGDPSGSLEIPFLRAPEDWRQDKSQPPEQVGLGDASGIILDDDMAIGFDDDDATITGFDLGGDTGFGEGGEAWARDAALEPMLKVHRVSGIGEGDNNDVTGDFDMTENDPYTVSLSRPNANQEHENILSYFDNALKKDWAGPEHWKIRRIKDVTSATANPAPRQRKEKEPFEINFGSTLDPSLAEMIYNSSSSNSAISLPKTQWKTKGRNLLPDDKHFNSRELLRLFLKPKAKMGLRNLGRQNQRARQRDIAPSSNGEMDEAFWASQKPDMDQTGEGDARGAYDANFFADDEGLAFPDGLPMGGDDDDDNMPFADAREAFSPPTDPNANPAASAGASGGLTGLNALLNSVATPGSALSGGFGSQLVTQGGRRVRPEYVAYARVAKKVDVRRLKEVMWKGMGQGLIDSLSFNSSSPSAAVISPTPPTPAAQAPAENTPENENENEAAEPTPNEEEKDKDANEFNDSLRFTKVMNGLTGSYPGQTMRDISTSYCFICLLHLANEKGLVLQNKGDLENDWEGKLEEIFVTRDPGAVIEGEV